MYRVTLAVVASIVLAVARPASGWCPGTPEQFCYDNLPHGYEALVDLTPFVEDCAADIAQSGDGNAAAQNAEAAYYHAVVAWFQDYIQRCTSNPSTGATAPTAIALEAAPAGSGDVAGPPPPQPCSSGADCASGVCDVSDYDGSGFCGDVADPPPPQPCSSGADCASGVCLNGFCGPPSTCPPGSTPYQVCYDAIYDPDSALIFDPTGLIQDCANDVALSGGACDEVVPLYVTAYYRAVLTIVSNTLQRCFIDELTGQITGETTTTTVATTTSVECATSTTSTSTTTTWVPPTIVPSCTMGAGIPQTPPKPPKNSGLVKIAPSLTSTPAVKDTKFKFSGTLDGCTDFYGATPITSGSIKMQVEVPPGATCSNPLPGTPVKAKLQIKWNALDPKSHKPKTVAKDKFVSLVFLGTDIQGSSLEFVATTPAIVDPKSLFGGQHVSVVFVTDEANQPLATECASKTGLRLMHFTGLMGSSTLVVQR